VLGSNLVEEMNKTQNNTTPEHENTLNTRTFADIEKKCGCIIKTVKYLCWWIISLSGKFSMEEMKTTPNNEYKIEKLMGHQID
jgi:hypothetical protein